MKCRLTVDGVLLVTSETDIEEYALKVWYAKQLDYGNYTNWNIKIKSDKTTTDGVNDELYKL